MGWGDEISIITGITEDGEHFADVHLDKDKERTIGFADEDQKVALRYALRYATEVYPGTEITIH